jgi:hypothetical protein
MFRGEWVMQADKIDARAVELTEKMAHGLGVKGRTLERCTAKAGRWLPRRIRDEIAVIAEARALRGHPKLERRIDEARIERAYRHTASYLDGLDLGARRRRAALDMISLIAFRIFVVGALVVAVMLWRDLI